MLSRNLNCAVGAVSADDAASFPAANSVPGGRSKFDKIAGGVARSLQNHPLAAIILVSFLLRLLFAVSTGLGIDESYMVAIGRRIQWSYFDHPPIAWWLSWAAARIAGSEADWVVRLPFIALFAVSTWAMYELTFYLFGRRAALWACLAFNLAPEFGVTTGTWVLPDGPLICSLLVGTLALAHAIFGDESRSIRWWITAGLAGGAALLSKYSAALCMIGVPAFLAIHPVHRRWLLRWPLYVATAISLGLFSPVVWWNLHHNWASFMFQGGRATGFRFRPGMPFVVFGGEMLFLLPWIGLLLVREWAKALLNWRTDDRRFFLACLATTPIVLFVIVSLWSGSRIFFHWAAAGYLFVLPLAGAWLSQAAQQRPAWVKGCAAATVILVVGLTTVEATEVRFNWLPCVIDDFRSGRDPDMNAVDWRSFKTELARRGLLERPNLDIGVGHWHLAGKLDYALGGSLRVLCLCDDARQYGIIRPYQDDAGHDVLIVDRALDLVTIQKEFGRYFDSVDSLSPISILHDGQPSWRFGLYFGHNLHVPARD